MAIPKVSLLDRKLRRDLRSLKSQAFAVALVMACGLAMMILTRSLIRSLEETRDSYYRDFRFADVFVRLERAPNAVADELAAIPGVAAVQTGITLRATLDLPGVESPAVGLLQSLPEDGPLVLNRLYLRQGAMLGEEARSGPTQGRPLQDSNSGDVLAGEAFVEAHGLKPGARIGAVIYGRRQELRVTGVVLSPEFIFEAPPGAALPDHRTYGVFWMPYRELATASNLYNAFNQASIALAPGASEPAVIAAVDRILTPYGGAGAHGREVHSSHTRLRDEMKVLQGLSVGFPLVFLSVAAFMTNAIMSRQVALQREQIAILKAFGFGSRAIGWHYLKFSFAIVATGSVLGVIAGIVLGHKLVDMYHLFFRFPRLDFVLAKGVLGGAVAVSSLAAFAGVWGAVRAAVRLPPAEAMRPEPPASFRAALAERVGLRRVLSPTLRMALRNIERRPVRSGLTTLALALATGILVVPSSFRDGINHVLNYQWDVIQRQTATVALIEAGPAGALHDLERLPGVTLAEPMRAAPAELRNGSRFRRLNIIGLPAGATLNRVMGPSGRRIVLPPGGIVISAKLAEVLGVRLGDPIRVSVLDGRRAEFTIPLRAVSEDFAGTAAFIELDVLNRMLGDGDRVSGVHLSVAAGRWSEFVSAIKETPRAASLVVKAAIRDSFRKTTAESIGLLQKIYLGFATVVAFGIVYNSARISLSERQRELATLRVVGFSRREVGMVLIGELAILTFLALPCGLVIGTGFAAGIIRSVNTEFVRLPLVITSANYAFAVAVVCCASLLSAFFATRRLDRLDLAAALKAAE